MTAGLKTWWAGRSRREQVMLLVAGVLAALVLGWLLVIRPLDGALEEAQARHDAALLALAEAKADEAARSSAPPPAYAPAGPIDGLVGRTAAEAGFPDARIEAAGPDQASATIAAARPQAVFAWIAGLERQGVRVESLDARANSDQTLAVDVRFAAERG